MNLNSPVPKISDPFSSETIATLKTLEKKRKFIENRMLLWLTVPLIWILTAIIFVQFQSAGLLIFTVITWIFYPVTLGIYLHVVLPSNEEISNQYKKAVVPDLLKIAGGEAAYSLSHTLKVEPFLKSGLYHDNYSRFERADSIIGEYKKIKFGLYELGVQIKTTLGNRNYTSTPETSIYTNLFYGWVLHVIIRPVNGKTYIIPKGKKNVGESDEKNFLFKFSKAAMRILIPLFLFTQQICQKRKKFFSLNFENFFGLFCMNQQTRPVFHL